MWQGVVAVCFRVLQCVAFLVQTVAAVGVCCRVLQGDAE